MILRQYQEDCVKEALKAIAKFFDTLIIAPTGAGKTIILSEIIRRLIGDNEDTLFSSGIAVVLQHRLNLVKQNSEKFLRVAPDFLLNTGTLTGNEKNVNGQVIFATVQTLSGDGNFELIPVIDYLIIDEAHHAAADTYTETIEHYREVNPNLKVIGLTATADRADGKGLGDVFTNVAYKIETDFLIEMGYLVPPDSYVVSMGLDKEIDGLRDERMSEKARNEKLAGIYEPMRYRIAEEWERMASKRHTICFCTTIEEAVDMSDLFNERGHKAHFIHSHLPDKVNAAITDQFERGEHQVLFNVGILTEGFDCPTVNCVMLMRSCSAKSTMIQMIGRGLRPIVEEKDMWMDKVDCMVLDFGDSIKTHGTLRSDVNLEKIKALRGEGESAVYVRCPECEKIVIVHDNDEYCPSCGAHIFEAIEEASKKDMRGDAETGKVRIKNFEMVAVNLTSNSPFRWVEVTKLMSGCPITTMVANGFEHMVAIGEISKDLWMAIGIPQKQKEAQILGVGKQAVAFAHCNNYMSTHEDDTSSKKSAHWHHKPPSNKQFEMLKKMQWNPEAGDGNPESSYEASCMISFTKGYRKFGTVIESEMERRGNGQRNEVNA